MLTSLIWHRNCEKYRDTNCIVKKLMPKALLINKLLMIFQIGKLSDVLQGSH